MAQQPSQIEQWNGPNSVRWIKHQAVLDRALQPFGNAALDALGPLTGARVLDVGCGCGDTTLALAQRVGPSGRACGLDVSEPMLAVARERANRLAAESGARVNIDFLLADATTARWQTSFDALSSRFGVMFFDDPVTAFTNLHAALTPRGRLSFVCWRAIEDNPWWIVPLQALHSVMSELPPPSAAHDAPGPHAFADPERVRTILARAGFQHVQLELCEHEVLFAEDGLEHAVDFTLTSGPAARALLNASDDMRARARDKLRDVLAPYLRGQRTALPGSCWLVSAHA